jgi:hypothetical protein
MRRPFITVLVLLCACSGTTQLAAEATAPRPGPSQPAPTLYIHTRDATLPDNFILRHQADFVTTSPDEARFSLRLVFAAEEMADPGDWQVYLVDDQGRRHDPVAGDARRGRLAVRWNLRASDHSAGDFYPVRQIPGRDVYEARGSYRFVGPGLLRTQGLTLVARRGDYELRWRWSFADGPVRVDHHGPTPERYDNAIVIPGPYTDVAWRE